MSLPPLYNPLSFLPGKEEIRLLEILPDEGYGFLDCRFHIRPVNDCEFIALSYTWGPEIPTKDIHLNSQPFRVRKNLWDALEAIRKRLDATDAATKAGKSSRLSTLINIPTFGRPKEPPPSKYAKLGTPYLAPSPGQPPRRPLFWIDQLSINQEDVEERSAQVQMMAKIYRQASSVLIWLGTFKDPEVIAGAVNCLEATNALIEKKANYKKWYRPNDAQRKLMKEIAASEYWQRTWIVQEIMLASKALVQVGDTVFEYNELLPLFEKAPGNVNKNQTFAYASFDSWNIESTPMGRLLWTKTTLQDIQRSKSDVTLHMLLTLLEKQQCSDVRDKVYGVLSLIEVKNKSDNLLANYTLTKEEVYASVLTYSVNDRFADASRAVDLCCKVGYGLNVDWKHELIVSSTTDFLFKIVGEGELRGHWGKVNNLDLREEVTQRVRKCRWSSRSNDVVPQLLPGLHYILERTKKGW